MEILKQNMKIVWAGRVATVLATLPFVPSAIMKLTSNPKVVEGMNHLGLPEYLIIPLGILETLCVVVYLIPMTSVLGSILLTGYIGGAILTHLRVGESVLMQIAIGLLIWLGPYLREPRLRELLPLRKSRNYSLT
jgi:hypothetical protein